MCINSLEDLVEVLPNHKKTLNITTMTPSPLRKPATLEEYTAYKALKERESKLQPEPWYKRIFG